MFDKKKRLEECLQYANTVGQRFNQLHFHPETWLQEHLVIYDITPRQTGATSSIAELFDVENDLYISFNYTTVHEFNTRLYDLGKVSTKNVKAMKYMYMQSIPTENEKLIVSLAEKLSIHLPKNLTFMYPKQVRGKSVTGIVWIDMGAFGMFKYSNVIHNMIKQLYAVHPEVRFIVT